MIVRDARVNANVNEPVQFPWENGGHALNSGRSGWTTAAKAADPDWQARHGPRGVSDRVQVRCSLGDCDSLFSMTELPAEDRLFDVARLFDR